MDGGNNSGAKNTFWLDLVILLSILWFLALVGIYALAAYCPIVP